MQQCFFIDLRNHFSRNAGRFLCLLNNDSAVRFLDGVNDGIDIEWYERAQVDDFGFNAFRFFQFFSCFHCRVNH
ncbi:hypothetical protein D3C76_1633000 [compost metagenome]